MTESAQSRGLAPASVTKFDVLRFVYWLLGSLTVVLSWFVLSVQIATLTVAYLALCSVTVARYK